MCGLSMATPDAIAIYVSVVAFSPHAVKRIAATVGSRTGPRKLTVELHLELEGVWVKSCLEPENVDLLRVLGESGFQAQFPCGLRHTDS